MAEVMHLAQRELQQAGGVSLSEEARRELGLAQAFLVTGLAWAVLIMVSWLFWWLIGPDGREALSQTVGISAVQVAPYLVIFLGVEKIAAKSLLLAAVYHWI